jgi:hypothetical protein
LPAAPYVPRGTPNRLTPCSAGSYPPQEIEIGENSWFCGHFAENLLIATSCQISGYKNLARRLEKSGEIFSAVLKP